MNQKSKVHRGKTITLEAMIRQMTPLSEAEAALVIEMGGAYMGKYRCKSLDAKVKDGDHVSVYYRYPIVVVPVPFQAEWILQRKGGLLVAAKPSGLPTQGRRDADYMAFYELLKKELGSYVGLHHRLDQETSGLMLFTENRELNKDVARLFAERLVDKDYLAVCVGKWSFPEQETTISAPIATKKVNGKVRHLVAKDGKQAITKLALLAQKDDLLLIRAKPETGRTHQIRVHLSHLGLPLLGDIYYGGREPAGFYLHCSRLQWSRCGALEAGDFHLPVPKTWANLPIYEDAKC